MKIGHAKIVDLLATNGADVNKEIKGISPLFLAAKKGITLILNPNVRSKHWIHISKLKIPIEQTINGVNL